MSLADFKAYADRRAPFPSSTAAAGCPGFTTAAGVRRGRSGNARSAGGVAGDSGCGGHRTSRGDESEVARRVRMFWRSLGPNSEAPLYGADTLGTLFAEGDDDSWNVGKLVSVSV